MSVADLEEFLFLESAGLRDHVRRKSLAARVVVANIGVVKPACGLDAILGDDQLVHKPLKLLVGFELGIVLGHGKHA